MIRDMKPCPHCEFIPCHNNICDQCGEFYVPYSPTHLHIEIEIGSPLFEALTGYAYFHKLSHAHAAKHIIECALGPALTMPEAQ